jgi:LPPG:FO 2-phospho-L-lactate transferase
MLERREDDHVKVAALAGGIGAGKFLRGLVEVVPPEDVTIIVNTGDDIILHGLHVSPDLDSVTYWLAGAMDRERGWGRAEETFRATEELRAYGAEGSWFGLGDLDLATHLYRTRLLGDGMTLAEATAAVCSRFAIRSRVLPMSDDPVTTRVDALDATGIELDLHFQEYWVLRGARDEVKGVRYEGAVAAGPGGGVLEAVAGADAVLLCPSNPVASIDPILAVPGIRDGVVTRRPVVAGVSPIVGGAPLRGMADRLLPVVGVEVSAAGVAEHYRDLLGGWVIDDVDRSDRARVEALGIRVAITETVMSDDRTAASVARTALDLALGGGA